MKKNYLHRLIYLLGIVGLVSFQSCIIIEDDEVRYGPDGRDGKAFFSIDYDWNPPYSYWDNNPSMPDNAFYGEYYRTNPGVYDFEYYVSPWEYWWGTYEVFVYPGMPGQPNGIPGANGSDTYLKMICNDEGFYFEGDVDCTCIRTVEANGDIVVEVKDAERHFKVTMRKALVKDRPSVNQPKKHS
jgi:hypothetical protein